MRTRDGQQTFHFPVFVFIFCVIFLLFHQGEMWSLFHHGNEEELRSIYNACWRKATNVGLGLRRDEEKRKSAQLQVQQQRDLTKQMDSIRESHCVEVEGLKVELKRKTRLLEDEQGLKLQMEEQKKEAEKWCEELVGPILGAESIGVSCCGRSWWDLVADEVIPYRPERCARSYAHIIICAVPELESKKYPPLQFVNELEYLFIEDHNKQLCRYVTWRDLAQAAQE
jgi:hypothetical protein